MATSRRNVATSTGGPLRRWLSGGFTLLEVMIALAILAVSFTALLGTQSQAMIVTHYIRNVSVASILARSKLVELEHHYKKEGFGEFDADDDGDFGDEGYPDFNWVIHLEKIEADEAAIESMMAQIPTDPEEMKAGLATGPLAGVDLSNLQFNPAMMFGSLPLVLEQLGQKIRKVQFEINWPEGRKTRRKMSVSTYFIHFEEVQPQVETPGEDDGTDATGSKTAPSPPATKTTPPYDNKTK